MQRKKLIDWERIFLDTSIIIDYILGEHPSSPEIDDRRKFTVKLIDFLANNKTESNKERTFLISSITVSELKRLNKEGSSVDIEVVKALKTENVEFIPFDNEAAEFMNNSFYASLNSAQQREFVKESKILVDNNYSLARRWILIDLMIISCGAINSSKSDIILTADHKSFSAICERLGIFHAVVKKESFQISRNESIIFDLL